MPVRTFLAESVYIFNIISYSIGKPLEAVVVVLLLPAPRRACNKIFGSLVQILQQVLLVILHLLKRSLLLLLTVALTALLTVASRSVTLTALLTVASGSVASTASGSVASTASRSVASRSVASTASRSVASGSVASTASGSVASGSVASTASRSVALTALLTAASTASRSVALTALLTAASTASRWLRLVQPVLLGKVVKCDSGSVTAQLIAHAHPAVFGTPCAHVRHGLANLLTEIVKQLLLSIRPLAVSGAEVGHALAVYMDILHRYERSFGVARVDRCTGRGCRGREIVPDKSVVVIECPAGLAGAVVLTELVQYVKRFLCSS